MIVPLPQHVGLVPVVGAGISFHLLCETRRDCFLIEEMLGLLNGKDWSA